MPNLSENRWLRLLFLCVLYIAQGMPYGFVTVALRDYLIAGGQTEGDVGNLIAMVSLPWVFKFVWGPIIDRWGIHSMGKRRPWLILAQGMMVTVIMVLAFVPSLGQNLSLLGWGLLCLNIFIALQDVSTDSLAVDLVPENERGRANGLMYGSSFLGSSLGAIGIGWFLPKANSENSSVSLAFLVLAGVVIVISLFPLLLRERRGEKLLPWTAGSEQLKESEKPPESIARLFSMLGVAFNRRAAIFAALFAILVYVAVDILSTVGSSFFQKEHGWSREAYSNLEGILMWVSFGGAAFGGIVADKVGHKRGIMIGGGILALTWLAFPFVGDLLANKNFVIGVKSAQAFGQGFMAAAMFSLFMSLCDRRVSASQFTAFMALLNLSKTLGGKLTGPTNAAFEDTTHLFFTCGVFQIAVLVFLAVTVRVESRQPMRDEL